ncbi:DUF6115 domain-containing protein [Clostridium tepidiprofundi]|uniref:DUF6115 domain-containing protein n=1 Tax=Clostridium tepidiprofundi TaxID=420412 RepID=UPI0009FD90B0|nr:hypothetical protein [Clostridium tepidiprofundi]
MAILLIIIGLLLIIVNAVLLKKDSTSFSNVLYSTDEKLSDIDIKIGKLRNEFAETVLELQKEINELKSNNEGIKVENVEFNNDVNYSVSHDKKSYSTNSVNNVNIDKINILIKKGLSDDEIAQKLNIGKGEVLLIKELYLR